MFKLSKFDCCYEQDELHHIELSFTDGDKIIKHTIPENRRTVAVLEDVRYIYFGSGDCIPFPGSYHDFQYLGKLDGCHIFWAHQSNVGQRIISISFWRSSLWKGDSLFDERDGSYRFNANLHLIIYEKGDNPVTDKLLEVNNAEKIYVFVVREGYKELKMFSVSPKMDLSEIKFISRTPGVYEPAFVRFGSKENHLFGVAKEGGVYIATPNNAEERRYLYWQKRQ